MSNENYKIGVAGAGVMGSGIAQVMAISGCEVICRDTVSYTHLTLPTTPYV